MAPRGSPPISPPSPPSPSSPCVRRSTLCAPTVLLMSLLVLGLGFLSLFLRETPLSPVIFSSNNSRARTVGNRGKGTQKMEQQPMVDTRYMVPKALIDLGVYDPETDFENELGIKPTYWEQNNSESWGPCYPPRGAILGQWHNASGGGGGLVYNKNEPALSSSRSKVTTPSSKAVKKPQHPPEKGGGCRPGFLIIGAGKCGTSSLYHYLTAHPRVLPAYEKQIHYFKYHLSKNLGWYYSFFPTTQSFLEHGGLLTGEASPGYLPYPSVVQAVKRLMHPAMPKIIAIGREPVDRMYSSYKYNYVLPTIKHLQMGRIADILKDQPDEYYTQYLFSLEDFVRAELKQLRACFSDFGSAMTYDRWGTVDTFQPSVRERYLANGTNATVPPPLIDIEGVCYGKEVNKTVLRPQWAEMQMDHPDKVLLNFDLHLKQGMIGRSLYTFPLEWWYLVYPREEVYFVCTEELSNPDTLNDLALHLGLPPYNFSDAIAEGAYNVAGHKGYDTSTSWEELELEGQQHEGTEYSLEDGPSTDADAAAANSNSNSNLGSPSSRPPVSSTTIDGAAGTYDDEQYARTNGIPLPEDLLAELKEFIDPINERLFVLIGKRCNW